MRVTRIGTTHRAPIGRTPGRCGTRTCHVRMGWLSVTRGSILSMRDSGVPLAFDLRTAHVSLVLSLWGACCCAPVCVRVPQSPGRRAHRATDARNRRRIELVAAGNGRDARATGLAPHHCHSTGHAVAATGGHGRCASSTEVGSPGLYCGHEHLRRILRRLKLRAPGRQVGGRARGLFSRRGGFTHSEFRRTIRDMQGRRCGVSEVQVGAACCTGRDPRAAAAHWLNAGLP